MSAWDKTKIIFLSIFTLGLFWLFINKKNKTTSEILSIDNKIPFNLSKLISFLGNKENISDASATHSKVKIFINDHKKIQSDEIKKIKAISGLIISSSSITMIVGNSAKTIADKIKSELD